MSLTSSVLTKYLLFRSSLSSIFILVNCLSTASSPRFIFFHFTSSYALMACSFKVALQTRFCPPLSSSSFLDIIYFVRDYRLPDIFVPRTIINVVLRLHNHRPNFHAHLMSSSAFFIISHRVVCDNFLLSPLVILSCAFIFFHKDNHPI